LRSTRLVGERSLKCSRRGKKVKIREKWGKQDLKG